MNNEASFAVTFMAVIGSLFENEIVMVSTLFPLAPIVPTVSTLIAFRIFSIDDSRISWSSCTLVELKLFYDLAQQRSAHHLLLDQR